jgi:hypothetical protein
VEEEEMTLRAYRMPHRDSRERRTWSYEVRGDKTAIDVEIDLGECMIRLERQNALMESQEQIMYEVKKEAKAEALRLAKLAGVK